MASGEVHSLAELYERYSGAVFDYVLRVSGDRPLADDLTSETFFRAMVALDGFRGEASVKTWLLRIARNLYLRRAERERRTTSLDHLQERGVSFVGGQPDPEAHLLRQERSQAIQRALLSLRESDRSILLLSAKENMSCRQIGDVLDISVTAVKVRLYRARRRLISALSEHGVSPLRSVRREHQAEEGDNVEL
jgi:RNA polymerase sigma-70 factor (ECF subfamily)